MNILPAYEQMIAERLEGIAIPDMADAIWVRIETALDVEMPVTDTPAAPAGKPFFKEPAVWISAGLIAIIITLFILYRNWKTAPPPHRDLPQQTVPALKPDSSLNQDYKPPGTQKNIPGKKARTINEKQAADTAAAHSAFLNEKADSLLKKPPAILAPPVIITPPADKLPPPGTIKPTIEQKPPKKYGVEIPDTGYRFHVNPKD